MREPLLTGRLLLRDIEEGDAQSMLDLDSDPEVMRFIGPPPATEVGWYRERIRNVYLPYQAHPWHGVRLVHDRANGAFLGWVFVRPATAHIHAPSLGWNLPSNEEIGFRLHRHAWGRGFATEAATPLVQLALADPATTAVVACALVGNTRSLRALEKLGLQRVGEVRTPRANELTVKLSRNI